MSKPEMFACFHIGGIELAVPTLSLQEVVVYPNSVTAPSARAPSYLVGSFAFRNGMVPLVDVAKFLELPQNIELETSQRVAIVKIGVHRLGLLFDKTSEVLTAPEESIAHFDNLPQGPKSVIRRVLNLQGGDRLIEVFEPSALTDVQGILEILANSKGPEETVKKKRGPRRQCITFKSAGVTYGIPMEGIREIIKPPQVKRSVLTVDYCLGMFNLRGAIIPLICFERFMDTSIVKDTVFHDWQRILILRIGEIQIGMVVDGVDNITTFYEDELSQPKDKETKLHRMLEAHLQTPDGQSIFLLKEGKILDDSEILAISKGHHSLYGRAAKENLQKKNATDRKMYLCFQLQYPLSTRLNSIEEIAVPDENLLRPPGSPDFIAGMMNLRGEIMTIVDLRAYYGLTKVAATGNTKVLVTKGQKGKYGFLVDGIDSIETVDESEKIKLPVFLVRDIASHLQGDMSEVVEMKDMSGNRKTFMILDIPELVRKLELKTA